ncbi:MAG: hypothetical protein MR849_05645 [Oscillibacter sp.]|nr:hypothetical protein [Oscillibacter sp.]
MVIISFHHFVALIALHAHRRTFTVCRPDWGSQMHMQSAISVADFAASRRQINLIHRGGRSPSRHSDSRALQARQSCRFLETDSLYPPQAALRRFPCASAAILRSARHGECRALKIPLKAASRLEWALKGAAAPLL